MIYILNKLALYLYEGEFCFKVIERIYNREALFGTQMVTVFGLFGTAVSTFGLFGTTVSTFGLFGTP